MPNGGNRARRKQQWPKFRLLSAILGAVLGALLGVPASYYFQAGLLREFYSMPAYCREARNMLQQLLAEGIPAEGSDADLAALEALLQGIVIFAVAGFVACGLLGAASARRVRGTDRTPPPESGD